MRQIFYATTVTALIAAAAACSDTPPSKDSGVATQLCPTTIADATRTSGGSEGTNDSCHVDRYICVVGFQCGNFTQQATCTCDGTSGKFACALFNGDPVPDDTTDPTTLCNALKPDGSIDTCPTDKKAADTTPCNTSGEICPYASACTSSPPPQDTCQCSPNPNGNPGLSWQCDLHCQ